MMRELEELRHFEQNHCSSPEALNQVAKGRKSLLTLGRLRFNDGDKTTRVKKGLLKERFNGLLEHLGEENGEQIEHGPRLWSVDIQPVVISQWLRLDKIYDQEAFFSKTTSSHIQTIIASLWGLLTEISAKHNTPSDFLNYIPTGGSVIVRIPLGG